MKSWQVVTSVFAVWVMLFVGQYRIATYALAAVCLFILLRRYKTRDFEVRSRRFDVIALAGLTLGLLVFGYLVP
jgi:hypothetical protein